MKSAIALLALLALPCAAQQISPDDKSYLIGQLEKSRRMFLDSVMNVSDAQWRYKPAPDKWSVAEAAEHVARAEEFLMNIVVNRILKMQPTTETARSTREDDEKILAMNKDRSKKASAPDDIRPSGKYATKADAIAAFNHHRGRTLQFLKDAPFDFRAYRAKHPAGFTIDGAQWFLVISGHTERHTAQIREVQATAGYPKR
jgi:hypothetical protein